MLRRVLRDCTGSNLVEAALITPLLVLLTLAIVDFGSMFYVYLALEHGVSEASRFAITGNVLNDPSGAAMSREASIKAAISTALSSEATLWPLVSEGWVNRAITRAKSSSV